MVVNVVFARKIESRVINMLKKKGVRHAYFSTKELVDKTNNVYNVGAALGWLVNNSSKKMDIEKRSETRNNTTWIAQLR